MLEVGRVVKAHGLKGEVVVDLVTDHTERVAAGAALDGDGRTLTVVWSTPFQQRWIVQFDGVSSREEAEALRGTVLRAEPIDDPDALFVHDLIGCVVVDTAGVELGVVKAVEANPASDLLVLESGGLIPLTFLVDRAEGRLVVDPPAGLLDLE